MDFYSLALQRRSVNKFDPSVTISRRTLKQIIDLAALAPSSSNTQPWRAVIVDQPEMKEKLKAHAFKQPKITDASAVLIILGDTEAYKGKNPTYKSFVDNGYMDQAGLDGFIEMVEGLYANLQTPADFALRNSSLLAMSFMYAAQEFGWNTHPMIGFDPGAVRELLRIPQQYNINMLIAIGKIKSEVKLLPRNARKAAEDFCSYNTFMENEDPEFKNTYFDLPTVTLHDQTFTLIGSLPELNIPAPQFTVINRELQQVSLSALLKKPLIISAVPSLDTPVCSIQTRRFNELLKHYTASVSFITISGDTPFAQQRFCTSEKIDFPFYSDYKFLDFSRAYGVLINELRLCARSIFIVDTNGLLVYRQLVPEISNEPDYDDVIKYVEQKWNS